MYYYHTASKHVKEVDEKPQQEANNHNVRLELLSWALYIIEARKTPLLLPLYFSSEILW